MKSNYIELTINVRKDNLIDFFDGNPDGLLRRAKVKSERAER